MTQESPASLKVKNKIVNANFEEIIEVNKTFRTLPTENIKTLIRNNKDFTEITASAMSGLRLGFLNEEELEKGIISINTAVNLINDIPFIAELVKRLMEN